MGYQILKNNLRMIEVRVVRWSIKFWHLITDYGIGGIEAALLFQICHRKRFDGYVLKDIPAVYCSAHAPMSGPITARF